jgi:hypothetical protein
MSETKTETKATKRMTFEELQAENPSRKLVAGSLCWLEAENKQAVRIACDCGKERLVRTSDLWQVERCEACTRKARREHARERRKARKAEAKTEAVVTAS